MNICSICNKEFNTQQGLKRHLHTCKVKEETLPEVETIEVKGSTTNLSEDVMRKINKLKDLARSTYDAEARYNIECEIKKLMLD